MQKSIISLIVLLFAYSYPAYTQMKVQDGTVNNPTITAHPEAILELESTQRGFLPPRVSLVSTSNPAPLQEHVAGMIIYNTNDSIGLETGIYVNNGARWEKLLKRGDLTLNVGESISYNTQIPTYTANSIVLSTIRPDVLIIDGMRIDLLKLSQNYYAPRIYNVSSQNINITYQTFATQVNQNRSYIGNNLAVGSFVNIDSDTHVNWQNNITEVVTCNLIVNNSKWYRIIWFCYTNNSQYHIWNEVTRIY